MFFDKLTTEGMECKYRNKINKECNNCNSLKFTDTHIVCQKEDRKITNYSNIKRNKIGLPGWCPLK